MDYPAQDFSSTGGSGDEDTSFDGSGDTAATDNSAAIARLVAIFSETGRIAAKSRLLFHSVREGTGLTGSEVLTLVAIARAAEPCSVPGIGRFLGSPRQVVQRAIKVLARDGFIVALPDKGRRRAPLLTTTERGRAVIAQIDAAPEDIMAGLAANLPADVLASTHGGLVVLREGIDRVIGMRED